MDPKNNPKDSEKGKEEKKDKKKDLKDPKKDDKKEQKEKEKDKKDVTLQVVLLFDPSAAPPEKDPKKKNESSAGPNPNGWTKNIKFSFSLTTGDAMKLIRDKLKSDGIKVDLSNYGLYVPPPVDVWCAEKAKLKAYKLNDNCKVEVKPIPKDVKALSTKDAVKEADNICQIEFTDCNYHHSMKVDAQTKVSDIVSIITKQHPVDDVENYALVTVIDGVRAALNNDRLLASYYVKTGMKKMEMLHFERVFYKVLFVVSGLDVRLRIPVSTTVKDAIHIIFNKFGEDLKKSEHFALVLANRNISKCAGMILGSTDRLAYYVTKDKDSKFFLKYHKKDTSDLQLVKMKPERQLLKGETWVHIEARELNIKSQFLFDAELFITEVIQSVFDVNNITDQREHWSLLKNGKQLLDPLSKLSQLVGFGDKLLLKRNAEGKGKSGGAAKGPDGVAVVAEPSQPEVPGVFGAPPSTLEMVLDEGCRVPKILAELRKCIIEHDGLNFEGIFRVEGHNLKMKQFQADYNSHKPVDLGDNVHEASSLIKRFYDDLPNKLFGSLPDETLDACGNSEMALSVRRRLPTIERHLFAWLLKLLATVAQHHEQNKMDANNLGIVFGPLLALSRNPIHALMQTAKVVQILTSNIAHPPVGDEPLGEEEITDERQLEAMLSPDQLAQLAEWERVQKEKVAQGGVGGRKQARGAVRGMDMGQLMRNGPSAANTNSVEAGSPSIGGIPSSSGSGIHLDDEKSGTPKSLSLDFQPSTAASAASSSAKPALSSSVSSPLAATNSNALGNATANLFSASNGSGNVRGGSSTGAQSNSAASAELSSSSSRWTSAHSPSPAAETKRSATVSSPKGEHLPKEHPLNAAVIITPASPSATTTALYSPSTRGSGDTGGGGGGGGTNGTEGSGGKNSIAALKPPVVDDHSDSSNDSDIPCQTLPEKEVNDDL